MRVAVIGNMNNNANNLAKYLLDEGIDVEVLFFENEASHFAPDADDIDLPRYRSHTLSWGSYAAYFKSSGARFRADLASYHFLIGSRLSPAYCAKAGRHLDIFMPTGGDLHTLPVWNGWNPRDMIRFLGFARLQREAIRQVGALYWDVTNDEIEATIAPFTSNVERMVHAIPTVYHPDYDGENLAARRQQSQYVEQFLQARQGADIFLLSHVKHVWTRHGIAKYGRFHEKGNDQVIHALAQYYRSRPRKSLRLALFEYGDDHPSTRALAEELGVDRHITWFPQMPRREIMMGIAVSDGVIGEMARSWRSYGTIFEAMVMRRAVLHRYDEASDSLKDPYPMVHVQDAESLCRAFNDIADGSVDLVDIGNRGHDWLVKSSIRPAVEDIRSRIETKGIRPA